MPKRISDFDIRSADWRQHRGFVLDYIDTTIGNSDWMSYWRENVENGNFASLGCDESTVRRARRVRQEAIDSALVANAADRRIDKGLRSLRVVQKLNTIERRPLNVEAWNQAYLEKTLEAISAIKAEKPVYTIVKQSKSVSSDGEHVFYTYGDLHYSGSKDTENWVRLASMILNDIDKHGYQHVNIISLGDDIEGILHPNSLQNGNEGTTESWVKLDLLYESFFNEVLKRVKTMRLFYVSHSNHTQIRPLGTKRNEFMLEDIGVMMGHNLNKWSMRQNGRVEFHSSGRDGVIHWRNFRILHGHQGFASTPASLARAFFERGIVVIYGHKHQLKVDELPHGGKAIGAPASKPWNGGYEENMGYRQHPRFIKISGENADAIEVFDIFAQNIAPFCYNPINIVLVGGDSNGNSIDTVCTGSANDLGNPKGGKGKTRRSGEKVQRHKEGTPGTAKGKQG